MSEPTHEPARVEPMSEAAFARAYHELVEVYRAALPAAAADLRSMASRDERRALRERIHQIAGSAGNHGLAELTAAARRVLSRLTAGRSGAALDADDRACVCVLADLMERLSDRVP